MLVRTGKVGGDVAAVARFAAIVRVIWSPSGRMPMLMRVARRLDVSADGCDQTMRAGCVMHVRENAGSECQSC